MSNTTPHYLFLTTSTRESGHLGNTEWLAQQAAAALPAGTVQTWHHLARMSLPPFVDLRHTVGSYPAPEGDLKTLLDATLAATHIVFVSPVYWFSIPSPLSSSAMALPEPAPCVQPSVPCPAFTHSLPTRVWPMKGMLVGVAGRRPVQYWGLPPSSGVRRNSNSRASCNTLNGVAFA